MYMLRRIVPPIILLLLLGVSTWTLQGCPSPAAPPAPPAEIPTFLTLPSDLSIDIEEIASTSGALALKAQVTDPSRIEIAIEASGAAISEANQFLDIGLAPNRATEIPVRADLTNFRQDVTFTNGDGSESVTLEFKFDFTPFDLDNDGSAETCSGCTCPAGCSPDVSTCPGEAPPEALKSICVRGWLDGKRFLAGVFDRVPTKDNPQSGKIRFELPQFGDLSGSLFNIVYDHSNPNDLVTDLSVFFKDPDTAGGTDFFSNRHSIGRIEGPSEAAKKSAQLTSSFISPPSGSPGHLQFQSVYFSNLNFIALEVLADGAFGDEPPLGFLGIPDITPPICAEISTANPVSDILCSDLGLTLTSGNFPSEPLLEEVQLPPTSQFPESPTF